MTKSLHSQEIIYNSLYSLIAVQSPIGDIFYFITCLLEFVMVFFRENSVLVLVRVKGYKFASVFVW